MQYTLNANLLVNVFLLSKACINLVRLNMRWSNYYYAVNSLNDSHRPSESEAVAS